jgi:hypothetical protein
VVAYTKTEFVTGSNTQYLLYITLVNSLVAGHACFASSLDWDVFPTAGIGRKMLNTDAGTFIVMYCWQGGDAMVVLRCWLMK